MFLYTLINFYIFHFVSPPLDQMALSLRILGLLLVVAMGTVGQKPPGLSDTLIDLAEIQKDLYLKTVQFFNASVSQELGKFIGHLQALEARLDDMEKRFEDYGKADENPSILSWQIYTTILLVLNIMFVKARKILRMIIQIIVLRPFLLLNIIFFYSDNGHSV